MLPALPPVGTESFHISMDDGFHEYDFRGYKLTADRHMRPVWTVVAAGECIYSCTQLEIGPAEVSGEVLDWLSMNAGLDKAEVTFDCAVSEGDDDRDVDLE
jgi:hypothetical protein